MSDETEVEKSEADYAYDIFTDETTWNAAVLVATLKGVFIAVVFTLVTVLLFEGLWLWIGIGVVLLIVLPLWNVSKLVSAKEEFEETSDLMKMLPDDMKETFLKAMMEANIAEQKRQDSIKPLNKNPVTSVSRFSPNR